MSSSKNAVESMTGYGEARAELQGLPVICRVKSLNHRFLDLKIRLPKADLLSLDMAIRKKLGDTFTRGSIELTVSVESSQGRTATTDVALNLATAKAYFEAGRNLAKELGLKSPALSIEALLRLPGVLGSEGAGEIFHRIPESDILKKLVEPALEALKQARQKEGGKLLSHLLGLLDQIDRHVETIRELEQPEKEKARAALVERAQETLKLLGGVSGGGELASEEFTKRLQEESVFWIERRDFEEERVRLGIHLKDFRELLTVPGRLGEALGRKLEFLQQEILREVNTLGTKAQSTLVTSRTIEIKTILERIREQLANVA